MSSMWKGNSATLGRANEANPGSASPRSTGVPYYCCRCRHTFRHYPEGVDQAQQSQRLRKLAALCWALGLSYRGIEVVFAVIGVGIDHMSAWGDVQEAAGQLERSECKPVRVLGLDGAYVLGWGQKRPVMVAVDLGKASRWRSATWTNTTRKPCGAGWSRW